MLHNSGRVQFSIEPQLHRVHAGGSFQPFAGRKWWWLRKLIPPNFAAGNIQPLRHSPIVLFRLALWSSALRSPNSSGAGHLIGMGSANEVGSFFPSRVTVGYGYLTGNCEIRIGWFIFHDLRLFQWSSRLSIQLTVCSYLSVWSTSPPEIEMEPMFRVVASHLIHTRRVVSTKPSRTGNCTP